MTQTMQAALLEEHGRPLRMSTVARPRPARGEVLVRIKASGVDPLDLKIQEGVAAHARHPAPAILGLDMAGIIEELGPDVTAFRKGDEVYGMVGGVGGIQGTLAEFAAVDANLIAPKPANLSFRERRCCCWSSSPLGKDWSTGCMSGLARRCSFKAGRAALGSGDSPRPPFRGGGGGDRLRGRPRHHRARRGGIHRFQ